MFKYRGLYRELDDMLYEFAEGKTIFLNHVRQHFQAPTRTQEVETLLVERLILDGHLQEIEVEDVGQPRTLITARGILHVSNGGYRRQHRDEMLQRAWTVVKILATVLYSLAVLWVAFKGLAGG